MVDHDEHLHDAEELDAYCMSCKQKNPIEEPVPVWTRKGTPATRGVCSVCGTTVFRMGGTEAHESMAQPAAVQVSGPSIKKGAMSALATYVACDPADRELARRLADDLQNSGFPVWIDGLGDDGEDVAWASGVHPALSQCTRMVVVMSPAALASERVVAAWEYFQTQRKPIVLAQAEAVEVPDALRRSPRYDFGDDYKVALRQLVQALMG